MIFSISISGADNSISPKELVSLSNEYPFVEWDIGLQSKTTPQPARPSLAWLEELFSYSEWLRIIGHLHSRWRRDIVDYGHLSLREEHPKIWSSLKKIRLDIDEADHLNLLDALQIVDKEFVLGVSSLDNRTLQNVEKRTKVIPLINGFLNGNSSCGYLIDYSEIEKALTHFADVDDSKVWFCVKGFRGDDGITFDLEKVERCLDLVEDYVTADRWLQSLMETTEGKKKAISVYPAYSKV